MKQIQLIIKTKESETMFIEIIINNVVGLSFDYGSITELIVKYLEETVLKNSYFDFDRVVNIESRIMGIE